MVAALRQGRYGVDVLAVTAIVATVAVEEYWASLVVVLMLTTGEALDAIATGRATRGLSALMAARRRLRTCACPTRSTTAARTCPSTPCAPATRSW